MGIYRLNFLGGNWNYELLLRDLCYRTNSRYAVSEETPKQPISFDQKHLVTNCWSTWNSLYVWIFWNYKIVIRGIRTQQFNVIVLLLLFWLPKKLVHKFFFSDCISWQLQSYNIEDISWEVPYLSKKLILIMYIIQIGIWGRKRKLY